VVVVNGGVIDENVQVVSDCRKPAGRVPDAVRTAHVQGQDSCLSARRVDTFGSLSSLPLVAGSNRDVESASGKQPRHLEPDAAI